MSGLKVILPMSAVILVIFGVLLVTLFFTGTGEKNGATPTPSRTPVVTAPASPTALGANWRPLTPQA